MKKLLLGSTLALLLAACGTNTPNLTTTPTTTGETNQVTTEAVSSNENELLNAASLRSVPLATTSSVRTDGTVLVGGRAFFPFGMYHVSFYFDAARRIADMKELAAAGFNTIAPTTLSDADASFPAFVDAAGTAGMRVMANVGMDQIERLAPQLRNKPAVLGWNIADDAHIQYTPQQVLALKSRLKAADPNRLAYITVAAHGEDRQTSYFSGPDAVGNMSYPVAPGDSISAVYYTMRITVEEAAKKGVVPIANLQTFNWDDMPGVDIGARWPTDREVYNMTHQALVAGVKGILYYTFADKFTDVRSQPPVWSTLKKLAPEVGTLSNFIMNGKQQLLKTNDLMIAASSFTVGSQTLIGVVSLTDKRTQDAVVTIPNTSGKTLRRLLGNSNGLTLSGGQLRGKLAPLDVAWYVLR